MATGAEWIEIFKNKETGKLQELYSALNTLRSDPDFNQKYQDYGLFSGFPNLQMFIGEEIKRRTNLKEN